MGPYFLYLTVHIINSPFYRVKSARGDQTAQLIIKEQLQTFWCDKLLILDCVYTSEVLRGKTLGYQKFETKASGGQDFRIQKFEILAADTHDTIFTQAWRDLTAGKFIFKLTSGLDRLLSLNPKGFSTSRTRAILADHIPRCSST